MEYDRDASPPSDPNSSTVGSPPDDFDSLFTSMYNSVFDHDSKPTPLVATEQRLNRARRVLEYQQLSHHYDICLSRLEDFTAEIEALRRENADLRLANAALLKLITTSFDYLNKEISVGFSPKTSFLEPNQFHHVNLPKSVSVRTSRGSVKPNQTNAISDLIRRRAETREEERKAAEMEVYNQGMWKTELCNKWEETGTCPYGENCQFAHGISELRPVIRHPKYKTQLCRMVLYGDKCPYGHRCHFRHSLTQQERLLLPR